jgi:hypothetical protein
MNIKIKNDEAFLCCGKGRCPVLKKSKEEADHYTLTDDFGGEVLLTKNQLLVIQEALEALDDS